jgi:hypothetical protein
MRNRTVDVGPTARTLQVAAMGVILLGVLAMLAHSVINGPGGSSYMAEDSRPIVTVP